MRWQYGDMTNQTDADFTLDVEIKYVGGGDNQSAATTKDDIQPLVRGINIEVGTLPKPEGG